MVMTVEESLAGFELPAERPELNIGEQIVTAPLDVDSLIDLSQIRDRQHPRFRELKDDIRNNGLDNAINVAQVTPRRLAEYIRFVNHTWGAHYRLRDFKDVQQPDGRFNLIVAGHNRTQAVREIAAEVRESTGVDYRVTIPSKLMNNPTVDQIIKKQYSENIHSGVVSEREAMVTVERYRWGLGKDWHSPEQFIAMQSTDGRMQRNLRDTLYFERLPAIIQKDVFDRHMPYLAGVALGKALPLIHDAKRIEASAPYGPLTKELHDEISATVEVVLRGLTAHITNHPTMRKNAITAQTYIKSEAATYKSIVTRATGSSSQDIGFDELDLPEITMASPLEQARKQRHAAELELARTLRKLALNPHQDSTEALLRYGDIIPDLQATIAGDVTKANELLYEGLNTPPDAEILPMLFEDPAVEQIAV